MSFFILYFETPNEKSVRYDGFRDVGKYSIPRNLFAGNITIAFQGRQYCAALIADNSRQSASDFFLKGKSCLKEQLFEFIQARMRNECVVPHLCGFIETNSDEVFEIRKSRTLSPRSFIEKFGRELFEVGVDLAICAEPIK